MENEAQARAYAEADFSAAHDRFVALFQECFPGEVVQGTVLDLGCGPGDVTRRFARACPDCCLEGVDGSAAMLAWGRRLIEAVRLSERIRLRQLYLPTSELDGRAYDAVISNSLLHHLHDPQVLWQTIRQTARCGAPLFIMDLLRPASPARAAELVTSYAGDEPGILQHDFYHSLLAAYRPEELRTQLQQAGLSGLNVETVSDRHLIVYGRC